ncbi:hypothetical protein GOD54_23715 [Sinorhizobium medicae]|nr:hypothetical protein [Sinorhizobium medicae]
MAINPTYPDVGLADFQSDTIGGLAELFAGDTPQPVSVAGTYTAAQAATGIPKFTPVRVEYDGGPITLVDGTTVTKANAITTGTLKAGGTVAGSMGVYKAGCLNLKGPINWPASMDTDVKRLQAFDLATSQIFVKRPYYDN